jgi:predicted deacylase
VEHSTSDQTIDSILRFLNKIGVSQYEVRSIGYESILMEEEELINIRAHRAGIFYRVVGAGQNVHKGDTLARILAPYDCSVLEEVKTPESGVVFFAHNRPLALEHNVIYRIQRL